MQLVQCSPGGHGGAIQIQKKFAGGGGTRAVGRHGHADEGACSRPADLAAGWRGETLSLSLVSGLRGILRRSRRVGAGFLNSFGGTIPRAQWGQ